MERLNFYPATFTWQNSCLELVNRHISLLIITVWAVNTNSVSDVNQCCKIEKKTRFKCLCLWTWDLSPAPEKLILVKITRLCTLEYQTWQTPFLDKFTKCAKVCGLFYLIVLFGCWLAGQANSDHVVWVVDHTGKFIAASTQIHKYFEKHSWIKGAHVWTYSGIPEQLFIPKDSQFKDHNLYE